MGTIFHKAAHAFVDRFLESPLVKSLVLFANSAGISTIDIQKAFIGYTFDEKQYASLLSIKEQKLNKFPPHMLKKELEEFRTHGIPTATPSKAAVQQLYISNEFRVCGMVINNKVYIYLNLFNNNLYFCSCINIWFFFSFFVLFFFKPGRHDCSTRATGSTKA
jgi:hypothetical protein